MNLIRTTLTACVVAMVLSMGSFAPALAQDDDGRDGRLGGTRESIESIFDEPIPGDDDAVSVYQVEDGGTIQVTYHKDRALQFTILAKGASRAAPSSTDDDFKREEALVIAEQFLPKDADISDEPQETDDGEAIYAVSSAALETTFSKSTYKKYDVGGAPGDAYILLSLSDDDKVYALDISIGAADEAKADRWQTESSGDEITKAEQDYIDRVRDEIDTVRSASGKLVPLFDDMKIGNDQWTIQVVTQLVTYQSTYDEALLDLPPTERLQDINDKRIEYLSTLNTAADNYITSIDALDVDLFSTANDQVLDAAGIIDDLGDMLRDFERDPAAFGSVSSVAPTEVPALITECGVFSSFDEANAYYTAHPEAQPFLDPNFDGRACEVYFGIARAGGLISWTIAV